MTDQNFNKSEKYSDGKYKIFNLTSDSHDLRRIVCENESICIIPFDTNGDKVKNIYLARYSDYLNPNQQGHTCINVDCKKESGTSNFEEIHDVIKSELNIDADVNDLFFLGKIKHSLPFSKTYKCYGLNLDNYSKDLTGFTLNITDDEQKRRLYSLDKIKLTRILNGDIEDSLCLSAALLLISYIND